MGFDSVKEAILTHKVHVVILSSDISAKTEKEIRFFAEKNQVRVINASVTMAEIEYGTGRKAGVIGICDEGFAKKVLTLAT